MTVDAIRDFCLSLPHVTERVQWGDDLVFKVGNKTEKRMFCVVYLDVPAHLSFRPSEDHRQELLEFEDVIPAPYMARAGWVSVRDLREVPLKEIKAGIRESYEYYFGKLTKRVQRRLSNK